MESLEAFERGRDLDPGSPINPFKAEILPLKIEPSIPHVWQGFTRSAVFFLDEEIVLKAQKQYHVPSVSLPGDGMLLELGLVNFEGTRLERRQVFTVLQSSPHPNLVRCLDVSSVDDPGLLQGILFFERLSPLSTVFLAESSVACRRRWAIELTSAFSYLESLGLIPTHACVRDLGIDKNGRLKLMGFGASPRRSYSNPQEHEGTAADDHHQQQPLPSAEAVQHNMGRAHQRLASCLHYILTGIDPDEQAQQMGHGHHTQAERAQWRETVRRGGYAIAPGAEPIADILHGAWALRATTGGGGEGMRAFAEVGRKVRGALGPVEDDGDLQPIRDVDVQLLEGRCREWLGAQEREPRWLGAREYEEAVMKAMADCDV